MVKTITKEQYKNYNTEWVSCTGEQRLSSGIEIIFLLDSDDSNYYLSVEVPAHVYHFYDDNPEYDRSVLNETEKFCEEFGCKICDTLDEVNKFVREELPTYCEFVEGDDGVIYGW